MPKKAATKKAETTSKRKSATIAAESVPEPATVCIEHSGETRLMHYRRETKKTTFPSSLRNIKVSANDISFILLCVLSSLECRPQ